MKARKVKKFAAGGDMQSQNFMGYGGQNPFTPQSGGSAQQGLDMVSKGAGSINQALNSLGQSLSAANQAVGSNSNQAPGGFGQLPLLGLGQDKTMQSAAYGAQSPGMKKGGKVSSASKRGDGIAQRGKTKGRMI